MPVSGLAIVVTEASGARLASALSLAAGAAALGREVAMLFDGGSVAALLPGADDAAAVATALDLGVAITACQTGLAAGGWRAEHLRDGVATGGMVGFLSAHADAQLLLG